MSSSVSLSRQHTTIKKDSLLLYYEVRFFYPQSTYSISLPRHLLDRILTHAPASVTAIAPLIFVQYSTSPFVSCIHVRLPGIARRSEEALRRYLQGLSADAELAITTTSLIAKPRVSYVRLRDLQPVRRRFGIVSLSRDPTAENAARKWYMFRAVRDFNTQLNAAPPVPWAWDIVMGIIKRQSQRV